jgi:hypothetical protein
LRHYATILKVAGSIFVEIIGFFNWPKLFNRNIALGSAQPLTEMSTNTIPWGKEQSARKADNLTAVCEPIL